MVYAATNPVAGLLVERVHHWPGVNGLGALLAGRTLTVKRPRHFFRADGDMPEEVTLTLTIPPELGDAAVVRRELRERVAAVEEALAAERRRTGARVLGRRGVLRQSWRSSPNRPAPRGGLRPRVAARSRWQRVAALQRNRDFIDAYRAARMLWRAGLPAVFPPGTYWLARFANITVAAVA
jgi:putative transposase